MVNTTTASPTRCKRPRAWERRKEQRPGELLDAALEVFVARGYAAARLDDVAARAGVSKGTLYLYYAGKEDLFKAVVRVTILPVIEQFRHRIEQATGSSEELLADVLEGWWSCFSKPQIGGIMKLILGEASNFPEIARFFNDEVAIPTHAVIRQLVQRGIERQEFRQPCDLDTATHLVIAPLMLKLIWNHSVGQCCKPIIEPANFIRHHADLILTLLRPGADAATQAAPPIPQADRQECRAPSTTAGVGGDTRSPPSSSASFPQDTARVTAPLPS